MRCLALIDKAVLDAKSRVREVYGMFSPEK